MSTQHEDEVFSSKTIYGCGGFGPSGERIKNDYDFDTLQSFRCDILREIARDRCIQLSKRNSTARMNKRELITAIIRNVPSRRLVSKMNSELTIDRMRLNPQFVTLGELMEMGVQEVRETALSWGVELRNEERAMKKKYLLAIEIMANETK